MKTRRISLCRRRSEAFAAILLAVGCVLSGLCAGPLHAAEGKPTLDIWPSRAHLTGPRARQQLLVTLLHQAKPVRDVTATAKITSLDPQVVRVDQGVLHPVQNGSTQVRVQLGEQSATILVTVERMQQSQPVSFENEVLAALTKAGCNMGACHGSPSGKAGFRLSLRGFDPELDKLTLRQEVFGRRINRLQPAESLLLKKPMMEVAHGGGRRLKKGDAAYTVLHNWIAEGMSVADKQPRRLMRIEVTPSVRVFDETGTQQQLAVTGFFSDGTREDITPLTAFSSSSEDVATVSPAGVVEKVDRGETVILARYLDQMATSSLTFLEDVPGFRWQQPKSKSFVDDLVFAKLKRLQILPAPPASDAEFLRRVYLDVTGRLPRVEEARQFLTDNHPQKRSRLIDVLLDSRDHAEFWAMRWADVLRTNTKTLKSAGVHKFNRWLVGSVAADQPLDEFARQLLTARGSVFENPAANFWRASRNPEDAVETTAQLFLGIRMQCAKCHNHPFERWTQDNYYGLAAVFARVGYKTSARPDEEIVFLKSAGEVTQPRTKRRMPVHLLLQGDVEVPAGKDRRQVFADWLTKPDNPFFARAAVNRIWGHLLGRGLVEPVDDFRESNPASNQELLDALATEFVRNGYRRRPLMRKILNSQTYQLSARTNEFNKNDERYHSHAVTRLLSAEQLLDAISQVTGVEEKFAGVPAGTRAVALPEPPTNHYFLRVFGQPAREMACQCERSNESNLSQALQMINGPVIHDKLLKKNNRLSRLLTAQASDEDIVEEFYLAAVSRFPSPPEQQAARKYLAESADRRAALEDIAWAILNTKEFLFQH